MKLIYNLKSHKHGARDPMFLFDHLQFIIYYGGLLYVISPAAHFLGITSDNAWIILIPFSIVPIGWVWAWIRDRYACEASPKDHSCRGFKRLELTGRKCELGRILVDSNPQAKCVQTFRCGFTRQQQLILLAGILFVLPGMRLLFEIPIEILSIVCATAYSVFIAEVILDRRSFVVSRDKLTANSSSGFLSLQREELDLRNAEVSIDFRNGIISIMGRNTQTAIDLRDLYSPHRFSTALVSACSKNR